MTGTTKKMTASNAAFASSERYKPGRASAGVAPPPNWPMLDGGPAVTETGVVVDMFEIRVDIAEFLADALDEGANVRSVSFGAVAGHEVLAVHQVVDFAVGDVLAGPHREQCNDLEFGQSEVDRLIFPRRPVDVEAQLQPVDPDGV